MKNFLLLLLVTTAALFFASVKAIWIGEEFWTIVNYDGSLHNGRTFDDFIRFKGENINEFVAYWIDRRLDDKQFEAYGEAYLTNGRVCARFINDNDFPIEICGGFRVLSYGVHDRANPFDWYPIREVTHHRAVEYLNHQIARVWHNDRHLSIFGGAHVDRGLAYAVNRNGTSLHISRGSDLHFYELNVDLLVIKTGYHPKQDYLKGYPDDYRPRYGHVFTPDDVYPVYPAKEIRAPAPRPTLQRDECVDYHYDLNKDGYIDAAELSACRQRHHGYPSGCSFELHDLNKDGILDDSEIANCHHRYRVGRYHNPDTYARYCHDLYFDLNKDGIVDTSELDACRQRHHGYPSGCSLHLHDINTDGVLDDSEIADCHRYRDGLNPDRYVQYCQDLYFDLNKDGIVDAAEQEACRRGRHGHYQPYECNLALHDINRNGVLDASEVADCHRYRDGRYHDSDRYVRYCRDHYFDLNRDGTVDNDELERCLDRHSPNHRNGHHRFLGKRNYYYPSRYPRSGSTEDEKNLIETPANQLETKASDEIPIEDEIDRDNVNDENRPIEIPVHETSDTKSSNEDGVESDDIAENYPKSNEEVGDEAPLDKDE